MTCAVTGGTCGGSAPSFTFAGLANGSHTITLVATDAYGNHTTSAVTWNVDAVAPVVAISSPSGATTGKTGTIAYTNNDATAVVTCAITGGTCTGTAPNFGFSGLPDGSHTLTISARDPVGNVGSASVTWTVDATGPTLAITAPSGTTGTSGSVTYTSDGTATAMTCAITPGSCTVGGTAPSFTFAYSGLAGSAHTVTLTATDAYGNSTTAGPTTWTVDATGPTATITSPVGTTGLTGNVSFTFGEPVSNVTCNVDGAHAAACTGVGANYSFSTFGLSSAVHTVNVTATDAYGNAKTTSQSWTVDATGPTLAITAPTSREARRGTSSSVTYTSDNTATAMTCVITPGTCTVAGTAPTTFPLRRPVRRGAHGHTSTAIDAYGNTTTAGPVSWTVDATGPRRRSHHRPGRPARPAT